MLINYNNTKAYVLNLKYNDKNKHKNQDRILKLKPFENKYNFNNITPIKTDNFNK